MPLKIKSSKFRHIFGQPTRKENCFENIRITKNAHDSNFIAVNPKFLAVVLDGVGGGAFLVHSIKQLGRVDINAPKICGHAGPVNDIKWNPFDDHIIASASDDLTVKIWEVPELGLHSNMTSCVVELKGHGRRVTYIEWHPTAENVLLSCGFDYRCIVWDIGLGQALNVISCHGNTIFSLSWNHNGSLFATSCKDKKIRVIDPRSGRVLQEGFSHSGLKSCKVVFLKNNRIFTTGFSRNGDREIAMWNAEDLSEEIFRDAVDYSSGVLLPYYDPDIDIMYLAGKGDGNIRFYDVSGDRVVYLNQYPSSDPQRGLGQMPKRGLDVSKFEVARFYKLHTNKQIIEPLPMIVPRRSEEFAEDIYPPTLAANPAVTSMEWISGLDREPVKVSVKELAERGSTSEPSRVGTLRAFTKSLQRTQVVKPVQKTPHASPPPKNAPASLQNIYKLCTDTSKVSIHTLQPKQPVNSEEPKPVQQHESHEPSPPAANLLPSQIRQQQEQKLQHQQQQFMQKQQRLQQDKQHQQRVQQDKQHQQRVQQQSESSSPGISSHHNVKQAHVRPNSRTNDSSQQISPKQSQRVDGQSMSMTGHQRPQYIGDPEPSYSGYHGTVQSSTKHNHQPQVYQQASDQSLKWKHNSAWQKPAIPVGSTSGQYTVIGHHSSPRHSRQLADTEPASNLQPSFLSSGYSTYNASNAQPSLPSNNSFSEFTDSYLAPNNNKSKHSHSEHVRAKSCPADDEPSANDEARSWIVRRLSPELQSETDGNHSSHFVNKMSPSEAIKDLPLAYKFTSSMLSPQSETTDRIKVMSEVERKKKMKSMKEKIQRSSSASRVENLRVPDESTPSGAITPPAKLGLRPDSGTYEYEPLSPTSNHASSEEPVDERRKLLIAQKVAELKRIRDLARAYAQGELDEQTLCRLSVPSPNSGDVSPRPLSPMAVKRVEVGPIRSPNVENRSIAVLPAEATQGQHLHTSVPVEQSRAKGKSNRKTSRKAKPKHTSSRFAAPDFITTTEPTLDAPTVQRQMEIENQRTTNVSRYDNSSPCNVDNFPKFPVTQYRHNEDTATLYDNQSRPSTSKRTSAYTDVESTIEAVNKVSAPVVPQLQSSQTVNGAHPGASLSNDQLHRAYFKQCEEIKHLRQQNHLKDKKIETLEKELVQLRKMIITH